MYLLLHGDDLSLIDRQVFKYKDSGYKYFYGSFNNLVSTLNSLSMFGETNYLLNLDNSVVKFNQELFTVLNRYKDSTNTHIVFYSYNKIKIDKNIKALFNDIIQFNLADNKEVFKFLDSVFSGNRKHSLEYIKKILDEEKNSMYIISMLFYSTKNLIYLHFNPESFGKLHPYVQSKTRIYSKSFTSKNVHQTLKALSQAEIRIKSGGSSLDILFSLVYYLSSL